MEFVPVDEHLVLEDDTMRLDVYHVLGHTHMPNGIFAYAPEQRVLMEGDLFDCKWAFHLWAGAAPQNAAHYGLEPEVDIPVHGAVTPWPELLEITERQTEAAREWCEATAASGNFRAGCPVQVMTE